MTGGGYARTIKTEGGYRPDTNFIIERPAVGGGYPDKQSGNEDRESNDRCEYSACEGLQRLRQSAHDGGNGIDGNGGEVVKANGIDIGKSMAFFCGEYQSLSRTLTTDDTSGVVEWKD